MIKKNNKLKRNNLTHKNKNSEYRLFCIKYKSINKIQHKSHYNPKNKNMNHITIKYYICKGIESLPQTQIF